MRHVGRIASLNVSDGGVPKLPVAKARLGWRGLAGDRQAHPKIHGGPERAVCLLALEVIEKLRAEGHPIAPGTIGENVTLEGVDYGSLVAGTRLALGDTAVIQLTKHAKPCHQIVASFVDGAIDRVAAGTPFARFYARVLVEGDLARGDEVRVLG